ncbi:MAG TPA: rhodanese-like domain-containing protein [Stellaceae bacterium]|nr:rhodanese-like domain-containing protein [Stellaceae bacterium]
MLRFPWFLVCIFTLVAGPSAAQLFDPGPSGYDEEASDFGLPPQDIIHQGPPHAPTPLTIPGAARITTAELYGAMQAGQPMVLLYVNENGEAIAGSHWLFGAGRGRGRDFSDDIEGRLNRKLATLTGANRNAMIVTFCFDSHCWLSYNAALRAAKLGYRNVRWYRGGREAWHAAGLPTVPVAQEAW